MHNLHKFYAEFDVEININEENVRRCNNVSHFDSGLVIKNSYLCTYEKYFKAFPPKGDYTDDQLDALLKRAAKWKGLIEDACNEELRRRADLQGAGH